MTLQQLGDVWGTVRRQEIHRGFTIPRHTAGSEAPDNWPEVGSRSISTVADVTVGNDGLRQLNLKTFESAELSSYVND